MTTMAEWAKISIPYPSGEDVTVIELISWWAGSVMKLKNDIDSGQRLADDDEGKLWHVYDLVGAYALRGRVQQAFDKVVETYGPTRIALLEAVDTLFVSFTEVDSRHVARDAERRGFVPRSGAWWWDRLPTSGPVAEHARTFPDGGFILEDLEGPEGD